MTKKEYETGYRKPPQSSQFKPGRSGNSKGRPKGSKNLATDLKEELDSKILVNEGGQSKRITKQRALVKTLAAKSLKGDVRAMNTLLKLIDKSLVEEPQELEEPRLRNDDLEILEAFLKRQK